MTKDCQNDNLPTFSKDLNVCKMSMPNMMKQRGLPL